MSVEQCGWRGDPWRSGSRGQEVVGVLEALKSEPILDTGERKIKSTRGKQESQREPCPPFNIKSRNLGESKRERRHRHFLQSILLSHSWEI